jgi:hypothetical protein
MPDFVLTMVKWTHDRLGPRYTVERVINGGVASEYYVNRRQAIYITAKSETPTAGDITIEVIEKFEADKRAVISAQNR